MSVESHHRLISGVRRAFDKAKGDKTAGKVNGKPRRRTLSEHMEQIDREAPAVLALIAFAQQLAGTYSLPPPEPPPEPVGIGNAPLQVPESSPPRARPPLPERPRWTKDIRPGPHDVLTWEEAMQVPWYDPFKEGDC